MTKTSKCRTPTTAAKHGKGVSAEPIIVAKDDYSSGQALLERAAAHQADGANLIRGVWIEC